MWDSVLHALEKTGFSKECYYCQHGYDKPREVEKTQGTLDIKYVESLYVNLQKMNVWTYP